MIPQGMPRFPCGLTTWSQWSGFYTGVTHVECGASDRDMKYGNGRQTTTVLRNVLVWRLARYLDRKRVRGCANSSVITLAVSPPDDSRS